MDEITTKRAMTVPRHLGRLGRIAMMCAAAFFAAACDQNAIFYDIAHETKPKDPIVTGTPAQPVMFQSKMWVASGKLWTYDGSDWTRVSKPDNGSVRDIAVASSTMYVLTISGTDETTTSLYSSEDGSTWTEVKLASSASSYTMLDSLFVANDKLFVGAHEADDSTENWAILYESGGTLSAGIEDLDTGGELQGAAYADSTYYVATTNLGIYCANSPDLSDATVIDGTTDYNLNGMIAVGSSTTEIIAVGSNEYLLYGDSNGFTAKKYSDIIFTGGLLVYEAGDDDILLLSIDDDDYTYVYGYREIILPDGDFSSSSLSLHEPGDTTPTTVSDQDQYEGSIGEEAINHFFQYDSSGDNILFACTQLDGLWSYRDDEWNAEGTD